MSLTALVGFRNAAPTYRTEIMESWFKGNTVCNIRIPVVTAVVAAAPSKAPAAQNNKSGVQKISTEEGSFAIVKNLRQITPKAASTPPAPLAIVDAAPQSLWERMEYTIGTTSDSSMFLADHGILSKFTTDSAVIDMAMSPDGSLTTSIRSEDGYRRTVICRPNGSIAQRVTTPDGKELVRFASDGQAHLKI